RNLFRLDEAEGVLIPTYGIDSVVRVGSIVKRESRVIGNRDVLAEVRFVGEDVGAPNIVAGILDVRVNEGVVILNILGVGHKQGFHLCTALPFIVETL